MPQLELRQRLTTNTRLSVTAVAKHGGDFIGNIDVDAAGAITFTAGNRARNNVQIGHGGDDADYTTTDIGNIGKIDVTTTNGGAITFRSGTGDNTYAMIGHGGRDTAGNHGDDGDALTLAAADAAASKITVNSAGGITFDASQATGNNEQFVQIGHGGYTSRGDNFGDIEVSAGGTVAFTAGDRVRAYAQIGNGGYDSDEPNTTDPAGQGNVGIISVTTMGVGSNINFSSGSNTDSYSQIGHGGRAVSGDHGVIDPAGARTAHGSITVNSSGSIAFTAANNTRAYTQIGHGGDEARGDRAGAIDVDAVGSISFSSGDATRAFSMIGHGGYNADSADNDADNASQGDTGQIDVTAGDGHRLPCGRGRSIRLYPNWPRRSAYAGGAHREHQRHLRYGFRRDDSVSLRRFCGDAE